MRYRLFPAFFVLLATAALGGARGQTPSPTLALDSPRAWTAYGGGAHHTHYSALDQITRSNVDQLERAWTYHTGDEGPTIETNPVIVDSVMYVVSPDLDVIALQAATGEERWRFDPYEAFDTPSFWHHVCRGVTYWTDGDEARIFAPVGPYLYALDAETGEVVPEFGGDGRINLRKGLGGDASDVRVMMTSPAVTYEDVLIVGPNVPDGTESAPGHVRAYNARTGEREWIFHTIPRPGEFGHDTWEGDSWTTAGGANPWAGMSVDRERGLVFVPTGATAYDFYGGHREGKNLFANTLLALDAETGKRVWHYQMVHHDLWDYDLPAPPTLITVEHEGRSVDAVAQVTKMGFVFVLNRETGEPLFPVKERPVPDSDIPGEAAWPTQPIPTKPPPFARQGFTRADVTDRSVAARDSVHRYLDTLRTGELYTPGSREGTVMMPGYLGGGNWSGAAFDPATDHLYVNANNTPSILQLKRAPDSLRNQPGYPNYVSTGYHNFSDHEDYPAVKPPWGTLTAIDLRSGTIDWQVPLGTYPNLADEPYSPTGTMNLGGAIVTGGGLVFIGSTLDNTFRAFDQETGEVLWEAPLPTGGRALPSTYEVDGTQYVVIAAGGGVGSRGERPHETPPGDAYLAFALPARSDDSN